VNICVLGKGGKPKRLRRGEKDVERYGEEGGWFGGMP